MALGTSTTRLGDQLIWTCSVHTSSRVSILNINLLMNLDSQKLRRCYSLRHLHIPRTAYNYLGYRRIHCPLLHMGQLLYLVLHVEQPAISLHRSAHLARQDRRYESPLPTYSVMGEERQPRHGRPSRLVPRWEDLSHVFCKLLLDTQLQLGTSDLEW